jgi:acyl-CoA thioester hydrolase
MDELPLTDPACYEHWMDEQVRFCDTDLVGHVNNVAFAAYVESGRVAYAWQLLADAGLDAGLTLRHLEIDYLQELHYPARLRVGSCLLAVGHTSLTVGTGVFAEERCVATGRSVLVAVGPDGAVPLGERTRATLLEQVTAPAGR